MFIHQKCIGCNHLKGTPCDMYDYAEFQHTRIGGCAGRTHSKTVVAEGKGFVDPLKASKQTAKGMRRK